LDLPGSFDRDIPVSDGLFDFLIVFTIQSSKLIAGSALKSGLLSSEGVKKIENEEEG